MDKLFGIEDETEVGSLQVARSRGAERKRVKVGADDAGAEKGVAQVLAADRSQNDGPLSLNFETLNYCSRESESLLVQFSNWTPKPARTIVAHLSSARS